MLSNLNLGLLEIISDFIVIIGGFLALCWGIYQHFKSRQNQYKLDFEISGQVHILKENRKLVDIAITFITKGSAAVFTKATFNDNLLHIKKIIANGNQVIKFNELPNLCPPIKYLELTYTEIGDINKTITFEPDQEQTFHAVFSTDYSGPLFLRLVFIDIDDTYLTTESIISI